MLKAPFRIIYFTLNLILLLTRLGCYLPPPKTQSREKPKEKRMSENAQTRVIDQISHKNDD